MGTGQSRTIPNFRGILLLPEAFVGLNACPVPEQLGAEQRPVTRHMAIRDPFVLRMLARVEALAAFLASEAFWMPVVPKRLLPLR